ncbi:BEACH domain-containing protein lvsF [Galdieria sulphuraria]|nr:BEACH domain-containing protein lvsF [Galdieria sulphuraria]
MIVGERRFSVYTLEEGEVLLWDTVAEYQQVSSQQKESFGTLRGTGRLKVATHALYFDFDDWSLPILKLLFKDIHLLKGEGLNLKDVAEYAEIFELSSQNSDVSLIKECFPERSVVNTVFLRSNIATFLKEEGYDHPHIRETFRALHAIHSPYSTLEVVYTLCSELLMANKLEREERDLRLHEIVVSRRRITPFDITWLQFGLSESTIFDESCFLVYPLSEDHGRIRLTTCNVYFMPIHSGGFDSSPVERYSISSIHCVRRLEYRSFPCALEFWFSDSGPLWMVVFENQETRDNIYKQLMESTAAKEQKNSLIYLSASLSPESLLHLWQKRKISNYEYLLALNFQSGRTFLDISQYPVFPWILSDYKSESIDLEDSRSYRKLDNSIGALNIERLSTLMQRCNDMPSPKFLYGSHYSSPCSVVHFLVRSAPFLMLKLQNGRYDHPGRLFREISETWTNVNNQVNNFNELVPEFFSIVENELPENSLTRFSGRTWYPGIFLVNEYGIDFGTCQDGRKVDNVELPPWANGSPSEYIRMNRKALESDYVSEHLHLWIDLVFGYKSRSLENHNLFFTDVFETQRPDIAAEFGRTPKRIFSVPHPSRNFDVSKGILEESRYFIGEIFNLHEFSKVSAESNFIVDATVTADMIFTVWNDGAFLSHALNTEDVGKHFRRLSLSASSIEERLRNCKFTVVRETSTDCVILGTDTDAHQGELCSVLFEAESNTVISSSKDGTIRCWACEKESGPLSNCVLSGPGRLVYDLDAEDIVHDIAMERDPVDSQTMLAAVVDNAYVLLWKLDLICRHSDDPVLRPLIKISSVLSSTFRSMVVRDNLCFCEPWDNSGYTTGLVWMSSNGLMEYDVIDSIYWSHLKRMEWRNQASFWSRVDKCHILVLESNGQLSLVRFAYSQGKMEIVATKSVEDIDTGEVTKIGCYVSDIGKNSFAAYIVLRTGKIFGCILSV